MEDPKVLPASDHDTLVRMEVGQTQLFTEVRAMGEKWDKLYVDHETRLRALEKDSTSTKTSSKIDWKVVILTITVAAMIISAFIQRR